MPTPAIPLDGKCSLMPLFMGGQMSGRAFVRTPYELIRAYALIKSNKFKNKTRFRMNVA